MQGFYGNIKSTKNSFRDSQQTKLGQEARTGRIVDKEEVVFECSNCHKDLCIIKVTRPNAKIKSFIVARCGHCGDKSFKKEVVGGFIVGSTDSTSVVGYPMETSVEGEYYIQNLTIETKPRRQ